MAGFIDFSQHLLQEPLCSQYLCDSLSLGCRGCSASHRQVGEANSSSFSLLTSVLRYKIQQAALVPTMIRQLVNSPLLQASDPFREAVKSMTGIVSAAASLSPQVVERLYGVLRGQSNDTTAPDPPVSSVSLEAPSHGPHVMKYPSASVFRSL